MGFYHVLYHRHLSVEQKESLPPEAHQSHNVFVGCLLAAAPPKHMYRKEASCFVPSSRPSRRPGLHVRLSYPRLHHTFPNPTQLQAQTQHRDFP